MLTEDDIMLGAALGERVKRLEIHLDRLDSRFHSLLILMLGTFLSAVLTLLVVLFETAKQ